MEKSYRRKDLLMKKFRDEFKEFAFKGNVVDMAVGVIIGGAFGKIVTSIVGDIIMPLFGVITGGMNFSDLKIVLTPAVMDGATVVTPENALQYGAFLQNALDFFIIALSIFIVIKLMTKARSAFEKEKEAEVEEEAKEPSEDIVLLTEIRDLLKKDAENK